MQPKVKLAAVLTIPFLDAQQKEVSKEAGQKRAKPVQTIECNKLAA